MEIFKRVYLDAQKILQNKVTLEVMKEKRIKIGSMERRRREEIYRVWECIALRRYLNKQRNYDAF